MVASESVERPSGGRTCPSGETMPLKRPNWPNFPNDSSCRLPRSEAGDTAISTALIRDKKKPLMHPPIKQKRGQNPILPPFARSPPPLLRAIPTMDSPAKYGTKGAKLPVFGRYLPAMGAFPTRFFLGGAARSRKTSTAQLGGHVHRSRGRPLVSAARFVVHPEECSPHIRSQDRMPLPHGFAVAMGYLLHVRGYDGRLGPATA